MFSLNHTKIAIVGATGMVGQEFLKILEGENIPPKNIQLIASENSKEEKIAYQDEMLQVFTLDQIDTEVQIAFFSAGENVAKKYGPKLAQQGIFVIDNSPCFRMDPEIPLVIPEINGQDLKQSKKTYLIANPNCVTIGLLMALAPVQRAVGLKRIMVTTFQSVSGAGKQALTEFNGFDDLAGVFPKNIHKNVIPQIGGFLPGGICAEEEKVCRETKKIFHDDQIQVMATCVRVPVECGHSESICFETQQDLKIEEMELLISSFPGVIYTSGENFQTPREIVGLNEVFVSRLRKEGPKTFQIWITFDNIRKGAAFNGWQIAQALSQMN